VSINTIRAVLGGAVLLVAATCFADEWPDQFSAGVGPDAKKEFAALAEDERAAYKRALVACSLFVDEPTNFQFKTDCRTGGTGGSFIRLLFNRVILLTDMDQANIPHGERGTLHDNPGKAPIAALEKIYRDTERGEASHEIGSAPVASTTTGLVAQLAHAFGIIADRVKLARNSLPEGIGNNQTPPASKIAGQVLIPLQRQGGTFTVPVLINKVIPLNFVVDSGADDVSIPADVVSTLFRTGTLQKTDFIGKQNYTLADGSTIPSATFRIRSLTVNEVEIGNVKASVAPAAGELLLGQSFLSRFKSWSIDNERQALVLTQ